MYRNWTLCTPSSSPVYPCTGGSLLPAPLYFCVLWSSYWPNYCMELYKVICTVYIHCTFLQQAVLGVDLVVSFLGLLLWIYFNMSLPVTLQNLLRPSHPPPVLMGNNTDIVSPMLRCHALGNYPITTRDRFLQL